MNALDQLVAIVLEDDDVYPEDAPFIDHLDWDSLRHVQLIVAMQSQFGVDLSPDEVARITSKAAARTVLAGRGIVV
jgi:acyl carrier protein